MSKPFEQFAAKIDHEKALGTFPTTVEAIRRACQMVYEESDALFADGEILNANQVEQSLMEKLAEVSHGK